MIQLDELLLWSVEPAHSDRFLEEVMPHVASPPALPGLARLRHRFRAASTEGDELPSGQDGFWKYSVFADSIDALRRDAIAAGQEVTEPVQFLDIGYLCHLHEPGGNEIELLQRRFVPPLAETSADGHVGPPTLGLITLRVSAAAPTIALLRDGLGMTHLATMEVGDGDADGFRLEFLAWTDDEPPSRDPTDVANREWLYQRPFTIIELQHGPTVRSKRLATSGPGLAHISASTDDVESVRIGLESAGERWHSIDGNTIDVTTPDGHLIRISQVD